MTPKQKQKTTSQRNFYLVFLPGTLLIVTGLLMVMSAGVALGETVFDDKWHFIKEQLLPFSIGLATFLVAMVVPYQVWKRFAVVGFIGAVASLLVVFIPVLGGFSANGASRWFKIGGIITVQPSELVKLALIVYLAVWLANRSDKQILSFRESVVPFGIILALIAFLIMLQPDLGSLLVITAIGIGMFLLGGIKASHFFSILLVGLISFSIFIVASPYRLSRMTAFTHEEPSRLGKEYHIDQAKIAIGSGGVVGLGLGESRQKFSFLPEPVTDSIFAVFVEETGLIGGVLLILLYGLFGYGGVRVALASTDVFGRLLAFGITLWVVVQALINMLCITGTIPFSGVPLPFISFGGTALVMLMTAFGLLLSVAKYGIVKK